MKTNTFAPMQKLIDQLSKRLSDPLPGADAHNQMTPKLSTGSRVNFQYNQQPRKGAVLILLYEKNGSIHFPLIQRPLYDGVHSGQIGLPGGKYEPEDQDLYQTAKRETHEEIGVHPDEVHLIGNLSEFMVTASNHLVLPVIGYASGLPTFVPDKVEVEEVIEASLDELLDTSRIKIKQITTAHGYQLESPYFDLQGQVVWGATAMMLSEFVAILREL